MRKKRAQAANIFTAKWLVHTAHKYRFPRAAHRQRPRFFFSPHSLGREGRVKQKAKKRTVGSAQDRTGDFLRVKQTP